MTGQQLDLFHQPPDPPTDPEPDTEAAYTQIRDLPGDTFEDLFRRPEEAKAA